MAAHFCGAVSMAAKIISDTLPVTLSLVSELHLSFP
jgi:hypothetical protein